MLLNLARKLRTLIHTVAGKLGWLPPTLARISVGWLFLQTGWGKVHNLDQIVEYFRSLGIPAPEIQAPFASYMELICGALILVGLFTRLACIPEIVTMAVAIATAKKGDIHAWDDLFGVIEYFYLLVFLWLAVAGPGPLSLDALLARRLGKEPDCAADGLSSAEIA